MSTLIDDWWQSTWAFKGCSLVLVLFLLGNVKGLFGMWHYRVFRTMIIQLLVQQKQSIQWSNTSSEILFRPVITTSRSPLLECDFNGHKSNATFYSDLDFSRLELLCILFKDVIRRGDSRTTAQRGFTSVQPVLGGVSCTFRREIKPYQKYEIWSRVISWDQKWIYIVSHFVVAGRVKLPTSSAYTLDNWVSNGTRNDNESQQRKQGGTNRQTELDKSSRFSVDSDTLQKAVLASAISRYVFKEGRKTVPPEAVLRALGLHITEVPRQVGPSTSPITEAQSPSTYEHLRRTGCAGSADDLNPSSIEHNHATVLKPDFGDEKYIAGVLDVQGQADADGKKGFAHMKEGNSVGTAGMIGTEDPAAIHPLLDQILSQNVSHWSWRRLEQERLRGLKLATNFTELEQLASFLT